MSLGGSSLLIVSSLQQLLLQLLLEDLHLTIYRDAEFVLVNGLEVSHLGLMGELHLPGLDQIFHHFFQRSFRPHLSYTHLSVSIQAETEAGQKVHWVHVFYT